MRAGKVGPTGTSLGEGNFAFLNDTPDIGNLPKRERAFARDRSGCLLTGVADAIVCHILPYYWSSNDHSIEKTTTNVSKSALGIVIDMRQQQLEETLNEGCDELWNMLTLSSAIRKYWSRAYCGFRHVSTTDVRQAKKLDEQQIVRLQFIWLPRPPKETIPQGTGKFPEINISQQRPGKDYTTYPKTLEDYIPNHKDIDSLQPTIACNVPSGKIISVQISKRDAPKLVKMIEIQWGIVCLIAMSGGFETLFREQSRGSCCVGCGKVKNPDNPSP
jgi:HNH endonuclease